MSLSDTMPLHQVQRVMAAADSSACALDDLCNVLYRELGDEFRPVYQQVNRAADLIDNFRRDKGWAE